VAFIKTTWFLAVAVALASVSFAGVAQADSAAAYFRLQLRKGETYANVFSKAISIKGEGFKEIVSRISGSGTDTVVNPDPEAPVFNSSYRYDVFAEGSTKGVEVRDGGTTYCAQSRCVVDAESSGLSFNPLLWGTPPAELKPGQTWQIKISQPWELGPPGTETVRVVSLDPLNHVVMLDRWGSGSGESDSEDAHTAHITVGDKTDVAKIVPGPSHWSGQTVFRHGIILSDVILIERPVTLISKLGTFHGMEREYTLLNAMPPAG
jgi:hypothetical protein